MNRVINMYGYTQKVNSNTCANIYSKLWDSLERYKPVVFYPQKQSLVNNDPIEKISHHIWLSKHADSEKSKEISERHFYSLLKQYVKMDKDNPNFKHIFWINDEELIPLTVQKLQALGNIEIRTIDSLKDESKSITLIKKLVEEGLYGVAIDLTKYEVSRIFGGIVLDINYQITTDSNLTQVLDSYSFIGTGNIGYGRINIENSMFAAKKNHPILIETSNKVNNSLAHINFKCTNNVGITDKVYPLFSYAVLNNLDPYREGSPEEVMSSNGRAASFGEELIGIDSHSHSWIDNA